MMKTHKFKTKIYIKEDYREFDIEISEDELNEMDASDLQYFLEEQAIEELEDSIRYNPQDVEHEFGTEVDELVEDAEQYLAVKCVRCELTHSPNDEHKCDPKLLLKKKVAKINKVRI